MCLHMVLNIFTEVLSDPAILGIYLTLMPHLRTLCPCSMTYDALVRYNMSTIVHPRYM